MKITVYNENVMKNYIKALLVFLLAVSFGLLIFHVTRDAQFPLIDTKGFIAHEERNLIFIATALMLAVVLPVFALTAIIAWRYRASNASAKYLPDWEHNAVEEFIWWAIPCIIIVCLAGITWKTTHDLDPFRPFSSEEEIVQVVALNWKWLFIYPKHGVASLNVLEIPANSPVYFKITSDAPMNSFWIPALAGQIYAMSGMVTDLHVIADAPGTFRGSSANFSGKGFASMRFDVHAVPKPEYEAWIQSLKASSSSTLDRHAYDILTAPSENEPARYYGSVETDLFQSILEKYKDSMPSMDMAEHD